MIMRHTTKASGEANGFSLCPELIQEIFAHAHPMGHNENARELNLGFGYLYYGLVRSLRPRHVVVIGSGYGFSVVCLALGLRDNACGALTFVDPSYSLATQGPLKTIGGAAFWNDLQKVREHFDRFGVADVVTHHKLTSEDFFAQYESLGLPPIDLAFIDGNHSYAHVLHDVVQSVRRGHKNSYLLLHDTHIYLREALRHAGVKRLLKRKIAPRKDAFELVDLPFSSGVALVRVLEPRVWKQLS